MKKTITTLLLFIGVVSMHGQWTQATSYPLSKRAMFSFTINGKAYVGGGFSRNNGATEVTSDFYEFDPAANTYTKMADLPGTTARISAFAFSINGKGYICGGADTVSFLNRVFTTYEYNPATNTWTQKQDMPGNVQLANAFAAAANGKGYVFCNGETREYDPIADSWVIKANPFPKGNNSSGHFGFVLNNNIYVTGGAFPPNSGDLLMYDPTTDTWTSKASLPAGFLTNAFSFSIAGMGYVCGGLDNNFNNATSLYRYSPSTDVWQSAAAAAFPTNHTASGVSFVLGNDAYAGTGEDLSTNTYTSDMHKITLNNIGLAEETQAEVLSVYPNPAKDKIFVNYEGGEFSNLVLEMSDLQGKILLKKEINTSQTSLDLSNYPKGTYIVTMKNDDANFSVRKVVLE